MHESTSSRHRTFGAGSIAVSLGLALFAGQLAGVQAASAAPVVTQLAAAAKAKPKAAQSVNAKTISWGSLVKVTTRVTDVETGKVVTAGGKIRLQAYRNNKWTDWQSTTLPKSGTVTFTSRPLTTVTYRTLYLGAGDYESTASNRIQVKVNASRAKVLAEAGKHKGALYKYGAAGPKRFDCSGYTLWVYKAATGRKLPHKANSQQRYGKAVSKSAKKPGDLIVFRSGSYGYHAAIYAGDGKMWDSPHSGARVSKRKMISNNYVVRRLA